MGDEMGVETAIILGLTALSAVSTMSAANKKADAEIEQGNILAANKAKETKLKAARLQTSFLNSGLTLEGTPMATINDTFSTGLSDIEQIRSNANNKAKTALAEGRSSVLSGLATSFIAAGGAKWLGSLGATGSGINSINGIDLMGNTGSEIGAIY